MNHSAEVDRLYKDLLWHAKRRAVHRQQLIECLQLRTDPTMIGLVRFHLYHIESESAEMATKLGKATKKPKTKAEFVGFANVELSLEEKEDARSWIRKDEEVGVEIDEMASSGYKLSVQKSEAMGAYQATAFCTDSASPNAGRILSAYAPHWFDALAMLAYKHAIKCEGVWPDVDEAKGDLWG